MHVMINGRRVYVQSEAEASERVAKAAARCRDHLEWYGKAGRQGMVYNDRNQWILSIAFDGSTFEPADRRVNEQH